MGMLAARVRGALRVAGRDNHHHVVCRSSGAIADVDCVVAAAPCLTPADDHGYVIDAAEVVYRGLCPGCSTAQLPNATLWSGKDPLVR
jgi:Fe2+ or Zn2+ uptake regulation protein